MKNKKYIVKGTPIVPSLCGILMAVLWYLYFYFGQGKWTADMNTFSFSEMAGQELYLTLLSLLAPVLFFVAVLFLAEKDPRLVLLGMIGPIVQQLSLFIVYFTQNSPDYLFNSPIQFIAPFAALILFALTVEKVIPSKWIFVGFCGLAVILPLVLTLCGIGEFTVTQEGYDADYNVVRYTYYFWSDYLAYAFYYVGLAALTVQMRAPRKEDLVTVADLKKAYEEKMAAEEAVAAPEASEEAADEDPERSASEEA